MGIGASRGGMATKARIFAWPVVISLGIFSLTYASAGTAAVAVVAVLALLEISLSFDNAVVNAGVLRRMSNWWQVLFLTLGILIAVFGMRVLFPFLLVWATAGIGPQALLDLALHQPLEYAARLNEAHPAIAAFGSTFLFMIFLTFLVEEEERDVTWLRPIEKFFARAGRIQSLPTIIALGGLVAASAALPAQLLSVVMQAGVIGIVAFLAIKAMGNYFKRDQEGAEGADGQTEGRRVTGAVGSAAFAMFLYLEVIDATFSFDGVIGAFAISSDIFIIAAGLGIGALFVRAFTVLLVRTGTLDKYVFLEHGAHYAIGALGLMFFVSIVQPIPQLITGSVSVVIIGLAVVSSVHYNRKRPEVPPQSRHDDVAELNTQEPVLVSYEPATGDPLTRDGEPDSAL